MEEIKKTVNSIIKEQLGDNIEIDETSSLDSLGIDSIDKANIMIAIEENYGFQFEESEMFSIKNYTELISIIASKLK